MQLPIGAPGAMAQSRAIGAQAERGSWMLPEAKNQNLMYVADPGTGGVIVFTYNPPRYQFVGLLADASAPLGQCIDKAQHVFVTNSGGFNGGAVTLVYQHGGVYPIRILGDPAGAPAACAVDPTTNNLAVTSQSQEQTVQVAIYAKGKGRAKLISAPDFGYMSFCAYDDAGNFFADGINAGRREFILEELPAGSTTFVAIKVNKNIRPDGGMQWSGKRLAVGDPYTGIVYRFKIEGHVARVTGSTPINGTTVGSQFLITGRRIIDPSGYVQSRSGWLNFYPYPAGGEATRNLPNFSAPYSVVVSRAAS